MFILGAFHIMDTQNSQHRDFFKTPCLFYPIIILNIHVESFKGYAQKELGWVFLNVEIELSSCLQVSGDICVAKYV